MHVQVPLDEHDCSGQWPHSWFSRATGCVHNRPTINIIYISDDLLHTRYTVDSVIEGCSMRKNKKLMSMARVWFHNAVSLWFSVRLTIVFHSRLGAHGTGNIKLLKLFLKLYLDKIWQISHTNPKVTVILLFRYKIDFLVNSCLDTDPAGRDFMKEHTFSGLFVFLWKSVWSDHVLHHIRTCLDR